MPDTKTYTIKPLEWHPSIDGSYIYAKTAGGTYWVCETSWHWAFAKFVDEGTQSCESHVDGRHQAEENWLNRMEQDLDAVS